MSSKKKPSPKPTPVEDLQTPTESTTIAKPISAPVKDDILTLLGPKSSPKSVLINVTVLAPVKSYIESVAKDRNTTVSDIIREALFAYISNL